MKSTIIPQQKVMQGIDNFPMLTGRTLEAIQNPSDNRISNPLSIATSSIMELRYAVSELGIEEGHGILDDLENLISEKVRMKA